MIWNVKSIYGRKRNLSSSRRSGVLPCPVESNLSKKMIGMNRNWIMVLLCLLSGACSKDETPTRNDRPTVVRHIRVEASMPASRTELAPDGYHVLWSPGDTIGVYVRSGGDLTSANVPLVFEGTAPAADGVFYGDVSLTEGADDHTLYAYYPYCVSAGSDPAQIAFTLSSRQMQTAPGDSSHLGDYDFLVAGAVESTAGDFPGLMFRHAFSVVEVDLTGSAAMAGKSVESVMLFNTDAASVEMSGALVDMANMSGPFAFDLTAADNRMAAYTGGSAQINYAGVRFAEPAALGAEPLQTYLTINPANYSRGEGRVYVAVRTTDGYLATFSRPGLSIAPAQMKVIREELTAAVVPEGVIDLSAAGTANCYVASQAGQTYEFDASTAGNGVITPGLARAVQRYEGRTLDASLAGGKARLVWQSNPYLIEPGSVEYADGRIRFSLTERPAVLGGNAVIGLYPEGSSEALWSWHIWITDSSAEELEALAETYVMYRTYEEIYGAGSAVMMDRNLGAIYKEDGAYARSFRAPLYQWGRKDPFPWGLVVFDGQSVPHNFLSEWTAVLSTGSEGRYAGYTGNTWYATAHPETFIATSKESSFDWYYGAGAGTTAEFRNNELWGNPEGYTPGQTTVKTLFDPCPPGWKVPHPFVFSAFTKTGESASVASGNVNATGTFVQGWNFLYDGVHATYYPGVGYRYDEFAAFLFTPTGYYWSSAPRAGDQFGAWTFLFTSTGVSQGFPNTRGSGLPVRCMRE